MPPECTVRLGTLGLVQLPDPLEEYRSRAQTRLDELLPSVLEPPAPLHEAMRYSALAPAKRLRPMLCLAACESVGGSAEIGLDGACAVELVHAFSLIHDDLPAIDNDDLRRGLPTCHVQFGEGLALLAGDALFALAFQVLHQMNAPPEARLECIGLLAQASGSSGLVGGEVADVLAEGQDCSAEELALIHSRKTGALIAASCSIGAVLGGASNDRKRELARYGELVGLAFQIADDILNETSDPAALGKAVGTDRARSKATYPALYGLDSAKEEAARLCKEACSLVKGQETLIALAELSVNRES